MNEVGDCMYRGAYGLIFLFKWDKEKQAQIASELSSESDPEVETMYFARQVIDNACATQAIINILMNIQEDSSGHAGFHLGSELTALKEFTQTFDKEMKGLSIGNCATIRKVHNSFRSPQPLLQEKSEDGDASEAFHFISFVPVGQSVIELDGLQPAPRKVSQIHATNWIEDAVRVIQERMQSYGGAEQRFSVMALLPDSIVQLEEAIQELEGKIRTKKSNGEEKSEKEYLHWEQQAISLTEELREKKDKRQSWKKDNIYRRTDFTPLAFCMLKSFAKDGMLDM